MAKFQGVYISTRSLSGLYLLKMSVGMVIVCLLVHWFLKLFSMKYRTPEEYKGDLNLGADQFSDFISDFRINCRQLSILFLCFTENSGTIVLSPNGRLTISPFFPFFQGTVGIRTIRQRCLLGGHYFLALLCFDQDNKYHQLINHYQIRWY